LNFRRRFFKTDYSIDKFEVINPRRETYTFKFVYRKLLKMICLYSENVV